ncbi:MAG: type II toxin-antitoxin system Phd/YefM family antitoxin [Sulfuricellaceae bacterium]
MHASQWRLQNAKTQFSQVVEAALRGEPQHITRRGKQAVVVLSEQAFESLQRSAHIAAPGFVAHLLAMPKDEMPVEQTSLALREVDFP